MSAPARVGRAWRRLEPDQRLAAVAALLLLLSMLLPWYQETGNAIVDGKLASLADSKNAFQVYSFVEASIFLVALGVLALLFARGERKAFHLPGGDGTVVLAAGLWVMFLVFYRQLDKPGGRDEGPIQTSVGVQWGIFVAFLLGALLAYAGFRIRSAHIAEPAADDVPPMPSRPAEPAPGAPAGASGPAPAAARPAGRSRRAGRVDVAATDQLSFDDPAAPPREEHRAGEDGGDPATAVAGEEPRVTRRRRDPDEVFERPADPEDPTEFRPGRRRG
jgi:hypothetical protein